MDEALPDPDCTPLAAPAAPAPVGDDARRRPRLSRRWAELQARAEAGMSTAEYAVGTVAACAFAAVLYRVVTGNAVVSGLTDLVDAALATLS